MSPAPSHASTRRSVAVVLTAALLAVLALMGGGHVAQRHQRVSAAPTHTVGSVHVAAHHVASIDHASGVVHLDAGTPPADTPHGPALVVVPALDALQQAAPALPAELSRTRGPPTA